MTPMLRGAAARALLPVFVLALAVGLLAGCGSRNRARIMVPDSSFSVNVVPTPSDWPDEARDWHADPVIAAQQQRVYETYGTPEYFRFLWRGDGEVVRQGDLFDMLARHRKDPAKFIAERNPDMEWVYLDHGVTYRFTRSGPQRADLSDPIRIICQYGDPQEVKEHSGPDGARMLSYQYYNIGRIFYFRDGEKIREERQPPMSGYEVRR